jgi:hypothetical protein
VLVGLACLVVTTKADDEEVLKKDYYDPGIEDLDEVLATMPDSSGNMADEVKRKEVIQKYGHSKFTVSVDSIEPEGGPTTGNTRVLVRGGPF